MSRTIEVIVSPTGETTVQTNGYTGGECLQASRFLEDALGIATGERKTAEYYQAVETDQHIQQQ